MPTGAFRPPDTLLPGICKKPFQEALSLAEKMAFEERIQFVVVDSESRGAVSFGLAAKLAANLNAEYFKIEDLKVNQLVDIAKGGLS